MQNYMCLHRSFDVQLSPVAASIIDWAPKRDTCGVDTHAAAPVPSPSHGSDIPSRGRRGQAEDPRRRGGMPYIDSHGSLDSCCAAPSIRSEGRAGDQWPAQSHQQPEQAQQHEQERQVSFLRRSHGGMLVNSYAAVPLLKRGTFSLNAGLFASLGLSPGVTSPNATALPSLASALQSRFYASDVLQLECFWGWMQWCSLVNIVCYSWRAKAAPLCEVVGITPYTDWTMHVDHLLFSWSGFWRMYVRRDRESRSRSLISLDFPSSVSPLSSCSTDESRVSSVDKHSLETKAVTPTTFTSSTTVASKCEPDHEREATGVAHSTKKKSTERATPAVCIDHVGNTESSESELTRTEAPYRWWKVQEIRGGVGFAAKNDLVSGVNIYCGCSLHTARALTISAHVDALRRVCCSITSTTASFDFAARLRINLITWHRTEIDAGIGWRPIKRVPGLTCRLSHSVGRTSVGVTLLDVAEQWAIFSQCGDGITSKGTGQPPLPAGGLVEPSSHSSRGTWYGPYVGWLSRANNSIVGLMSPNSALGGASEESRLSEVSIGVRERFLRAATAGCSWVRSMFHHAKFDLTVGATANQELSKGVRFFVVVSAH